MYCATNATIFLGQHRLCKFLKLFITIIITQSFFEDKIIQKAKPKYKNKNTEKDNCNTEKSKETKETT